MAIADPKHAIFRDKALQKYIQNQEKSVLPHFILPRVWLFGGAVLLLLVGVGLIAWLGQIPRYATAPAIVLEDRVLPNQGNDEAVAAVLFSASAARSIHVGSPILLQISQSDAQKSYTVDSVSSEVLSSNDVLKRYNLRVTVPSQVIYVRLGSGSHKLYAGSFISSAQIQLGSEPLLALFSVFDVLLKD